MTNRWTDGNAYENISSVAVSDKIGVRTTLASSDVEIVVVVVVAVVVEGATIVNSSGASFTDIVAVSHENGVRSTSAPTDVEIVLVLVVVVVAVVINGDLIASAAFFTVRVTVDDKQGRS